MGVDAGCPLAVGADKLAITRSAHLFGRGRYSLDFADGWRLEFQAEDHSGWRRGLVVERVEIETLVRDAALGDNVSGTRLLHRIASAPRVTGFSPPPAFDDSDDVRPLGLMLKASARADLGIPVLEVPAAAAPQRTAEAIAAATSAVRAGSQLAFTVRLHIVLCAQDDGSGGANETIAPDFIEKVVPQVNAVYKTAGITFTFDKNRDFEFRKSTLLNQDLTIPAGTIFGTDPDKPPLTEEEKKAASKPHHDARTNLAKGRRGKLVIFFSDGTSIWFDKGRKQWRVSGRGGGFSSHETEYVVTWAGITDPKDPEEILGRGNHVAHEIGHNLHLPHTFVNFGHANFDTGDTKKMLEDLRTWIGNFIVQQVNRGWYSRTDGLKTLDGDRGLPLGGPDDRNDFERDQQKLSGLSVFDTPSDPGPHLLALENRAKGGAPKNETCGSVKSATVQAKFGANDVEPYVIKPDQNNVMSYYAQCDAAVPPHLSSGQVGRVRGALESGNRRHLLFPFKSRWSVNSNGFPLTLSVETVGPNGRFTGVLGTKEEDFVEGLWDVDRGRITFIRFGTSDLTTIQVYTGYLFREPSGQPVFAGSFEAFSGTGATAERSVFGWTASMVGTSVSDTDPVPRYWF